MNVTVAIAPESVVLRVGGQEQEGETIEATIDAVTGPVSQNIECVAKQVSEEAKDKQG